MIVLVAVLVAKLAVVQVAPLVKMPPCCLGAGGGPAASTVVACELTMRDLSEVARDL